MRNSTKRIFRTVLASVIVVVALFGRPPSSASAQGGTVSLEQAKRVAMSAAWGENVTIAFDDNGNMIVRSPGLPNHKILDKYEAVSIIDNKTTYTVTPKVQRMKLVIPLQPKLAEKTTEVRVGLIGIAISGALIYAPYEADGNTMALSQKDLVVDGIPFIDACNAHPNPFAVQYHYHGVPHCITEWLDKPVQHSHLIGYLLDGFPVYGPQDANGAPITPANLDACNGQFGPTPEFPDGIYHYVLTEEPPYSMPCFSGVVHDISSSPLSLLMRGVDLDYAPTQEPTATSSK